MPTQITESLPLVVSEADSSGQFEIQIITPGMGSSGYYPPTTLEAAAKSRVFGKGCHLFLDHPTASEAMERPERSVRDLAGALVEDARWTGTALVAKARVYSGYRPMLAEAAPDLGLSIRASGEISEGLFEGRKVPQIDELTEAVSVDFVTRAGRGGAVLAVLEANRNPEPVLAPIVPAAPAGSTTESSQEMNMPQLEEARLRELTEAEGKVKTLEAERDTATARAEKAEKALAERDLRDVAAKQAREAVKDLHPAMAGRVVESSLSDLPTTNDGALDAAAFGKVVEKAIEAETAYAAQLAPKGVTGFGASAPADQVAESTRPTTNPWGRSLSAVKEA